MAGDSSLRSRLRLWLSRVISSLRGRLWLRLRVALIVSSLWLRLCGILLRCWLWCWLRLWLTWIPLWLLLPWIVSSLRGRLSRILRSRLGELLVCLHRHFKYVEDIHLDHEGTHLAVCPLALVGLQFEFADYMYLGA